MMNKMTANSTTKLGSGQPTITEYSIRVPKTNKNKHHVMRFNYNLNVDFSKWRNNVTMGRENNMREFKMTQEEQDIPKFGAGSEYNRDMKEEARRKKFGIIAKKYDTERQPWIIKVGSGSKTGKKFRGIREGGVSENAAHFVFTQTKDGSIEAVPLNEWYNFQPIQRYKALTAEEAEEEFGRRRKCVNMWTMKMRMKLKNKDDEEAEVDPEETKAMKSGKGSDKKKLQISEMDEWMDSDDMSSSADEDEDKKKGDEDDSENEAKTKQKKEKGKKLQNLKKKKKRDVDDEAFEESDDGDEEGREKDYISDSSDSESEPETKANKELKSVAEEDALRKLLTSDEDSDEEKSNKDENESDDGSKKKPEDMPKESEVKAEKTKEKKREDKKTKMQKFYDAINQGPGTGHASDFSSDSDDSEVEKPTKKKKKFEKIINSSRSGTPVDAATSAANKRKVEAIANSDNSNSPQSTPAKKLKTEPFVASTTPFTNFSNSKDNFGNTEEAVRRYLMRKPMTTTELLKKIQSKKTGGVSSDELVELMTAVLKKINPSKQRIQGKMYLSLKAT